MRTLDLLIIILYMLVLIGVGVYSLRRARTHKDFIVAGRHLGPFLFTGALMATTIGGSYTMGGTSFGYFMGIGGIWWVLGSGIALGSLILIGRRISRLRVYTMTEISQHRYGTITRATIALIMIAVLLLTLAVQVLAAGTIMSALFDIPSSWGVITATAVIIIYCTIGGMWSITLTDIVQVFWMILGVIFILLPFLIWKTGGWSDLWSSLPAGYRDVGAWGWSANIIPWIVVIVAGSWTAGDYYQRLFTGRDARTVNIGLGSSAVFAGVWAVVVCLIGAAVFVLLPNLANPDDAFAQGVALLPQGASGIVYAASLAAVMSTAAGLLIAIGGTLCHDFLGLFVKALGESGRPSTATAVTRTAMVISAVVAVAVGLGVGSIVTIYSTAAIIGSVTFFAPIILGMVWETRGSSVAAMSSIVVGAVVAVIVMAMHGAGAMDTIYYALPASVLTWVAVALIQKPLDPNARARWARAFVEPDQRGRTPEPATPDASA